MVKSSKKALAVLLAVACLITFMPAMASQSFAAKKLTVKPAKKTIYVKKSVTLKANQKVKWSASKSSLKVVKLTSKKAKSVKVTGKKAGKAVVTAKVGKQTKKVTITVKKAKAAVKKTAVTGVEITAENVKDAVSKKVTIGETLRANVTPEDATVTYQWMADGTPIEGATKATFTTTTAQIGKAISVKVTGTGNYEKDATSEVTAKVESIEIKTVQLQKKGATKNDWTVTSNASAGDELRVLSSESTDATELKKDSSDFDQSAVAATYQWYRVGGTSVSGAAVETAIDGATSSTYTVTKADAGYKLKVVVTPVSGVKFSVSTDANGKTITKTTTATVAAGVKVALKVGTKTAKDNAFVGKELTADVTPAAAASDVSYQWYAGTTAIPGATSQKYTPTIAGEYKVVISLKTGESVWTLTSANSTATVTVAPNGTKTLAIENAWNANAYDAATGTSKTTNNIGDTLKVTTSPATATATTKWYVKGVKDAEGNDVEVGTKPAAVLKIPASVTVDDKTISLVGKSLYAVVKGTGEYAGSEATSKEFVVSAAASKITSATVKIGTKNATAVVDKNTIAVSGEAVTISSAGSNVVVTLTVGDGAKIATDVAGAKVEGKEITFSGVKTNSPLTFSVDQDGDGDAFTTTQYTIDLSKIARV